MNVLQAYCYYLYISFFSFFGSFLHGNGKKMVKKILICLFCLWILLAYAASALRKGIASQENLVGEFARSNLGGVAQALLNAQFSQAEEKEADDFGILFLKKYGFDTSAAVSALKKLGGLGKNHSFLSSHPDPVLRAERLQSHVDSPEKIGAPSFFDKMLARIISLFSSFYENLSGTTSSSPANITRADLTR